MPGPHFVYSAAGTPIEYEDIDLGKRWESFAVDHELTRAGIHKFVTDYRATLRGTASESYIVSWDESVPVVRLTSCPSQFLQPWDASDLRIHIPHGSLPHAHLASHRGEFTMMHRTSRAICT